MKILKNPTWRLLGPLFLRADFRHRYWFASTRTAYTWLAMAFLADLLAKSLVGQWNWWLLAMAVVAPVILSRMPARFAAAAGGLLVSQALGSIVLAFLLVALGVPYALREAILGGWAIWCGFALAYMGVMYLRTPRAVMPDA